MREVVVDIVAGKIERDFRVEPFRHSWMIGFCQKIQQLGRFKPEEMRFLPVDWRILELPAESR